MSDKFAKDQLEAFKTLFDSNDKDHDGKITFKEFTKIIQQIGSGVSPSKIEVWFHQVDSDKDGKIKFSQFIRVMFKMLKSVKASSKSSDGRKQAFKEFDKNGDGFITKSQLQYVMAKKFGEELSKEQVEEMIKEADVDGDGKIDYIEFKMLYKGFRML